MKFPKIYHAPWSLSVTSDDKIFPDMSCFDGKNLIYLEKLDGECTCCTREDIHARSEDGYGKPWQHYMTKLWSSFRMNIPDGMIIFGENVYAIHSIEYSRLPTCFFVFGMLVDGIYLGWKDVLEWSELIGLDTAPEIMRGTLDNIQIPSHSSFGEVCEGYVARNIDSFEMNDFQTNIMKSVRANHVQTDEHWTKNWKKAHFIDDPVERLMRQSKMY